MIDQRPDGPTVRVVLAKIFGIDPTEVGQLLAVAFGRIFLSAWLSKNNAMNGGSFLTCSGVSNDFAAGPKIAI